MWKPVKITAVIGALLVLTVLAVSCFAQQAVHVVAFTATWCHQCQLDKVYYPELQKRYPLTVYDYDQSPEAAQRWGVTKLPAYIAVLSDGTTYRTEHIANLLQ